LKEVTSACRHEAHCFKKRGCPAKGWKSSQNYSQWQSHTNKRSSLLK
jgi:hypothetical protein